MNPENCNQVAVTIPERIIGSTRPTSLLNSKNKKTGLLAPSTFSCKQLPETTDKRQEKKKTRKRNVKNTLVVRM